ncbi:MAG TPA: hypothetical protein VG838_10585 [Opitutaceae bacterium]|nr:hypothetical protein [Opitutaceae bacterium]
MKTFAKILLVTAGLGSCALPFVATAADTTAPSQAPAQAAGKHRHLRAMMQRRMARNHLAARKLGLSSDQIAQLKAVREQTKSGLKGLRADTSLTREQKKAKARELLQGARAQALGTLTAEQKNQLKQLREKRESGRRALL